MSEKKHPRRLKPDAPTPDVPRFDTEPAVYSPVAEPVKEWPELNRPGLVIKKTWSNREA